MQIVRNKSIGEVVMPSRIGDALRWYATYTPNKVALVSAAGTQTYAQLWSRVCRLSRALAELGVGPGDRIALQMQNSSRYIEVYQTAALMGVAVVPLNFRFVASEIVYVVDHCGARALMFDASFADTVELLRTKLPSVAERYIVIDGAATSTTHSYEVLIASGSEAPFDLGSLRLLLSGGSPLLTHTKEAILRRFPNAGLNEFYGGTEVGLVTNLRPEDQGRKVRSVGRPVIGMFVELRRMEMLFRMARSEKSISAARRSSANISTIRRRQRRHEKAGSLPWETWVASTRRVTSTSSIARRT
jgi:acyl-CoA synthetase (AMP-forming)/AMP-acid ligase II